jgi:hypothetical protein
MPNNLLSRLRFPRFRWHDGDTMLSFALLTVVIFGLLAARIADPANWIVIADTTHTADALTCER